MSFLEMSTSMTLNELELKKYWVWFLVIILRLFSLLKSELQQNG